MRTHAQHQTPSLICVNGRFGGPIVLDDCPRVMRQLLRPARSMIGPTGTKSIAAKIIDDESGARCDLAGVHGEGSRPDYHSKHRLPHGGRHCRGCDHGRCYGVAHERCRARRRWRFRKRVGTRCTQVHVPSVEDRYVLLEIYYDHSDASVRRLALG